MQDTPRKKSTGSKQKGASPDSLSGFDRMASFPHKNPNPVLEINREGNIQYINPAAENLFPDLPEKTIHHAYLAGWSECLERLNANPALNIIREVQVGDHFYQQSLFYVPELDCLRVYGIDVTELMKAGETIKKLSLAADQSPVSIVITDTRGNIEYVNAKFSEVTGFTAAEAIGQNPRILKSGKTPEAVYQDLWSTILSGRIWRGEFCNRKKNGEYYWESASISPIISPEGVITHFVSVKQDISEQKRVLASLRQNQSLLKEIIDGIPDPIFVKDRQGRMTMANPGTFTVVGKPADQIIGKTDIEFYDDPEVGRVIMENDRRIMETGTAEVLEEMAPTPEGYKTYLSTKIPWRDETGQVIGLLGVARDITRRKQMEEELRASERRWSTTLASIGDAVIATDTNSRITFLNPEAEKLTGWGQDEAKAKPITEVFKIINEQTRLAVIDPVSKVLEKGTIIGLANHSLLVRRDGTEVPIDDSGAPIKNEAGETIGVVLVFRDITERRLKEEQIAKMTRFYMVLNRVNELIARTHLPDVLFDGVCRIVSEGGYPLVWIGEVRGRQVVPVSWCGPAEDYLREIRVEVDGVLGMGPSGTAIREGHPVINDDFVTNPATLPWRTPATRYGFRASASFPLHRSGKVIASLTVYSEDPGTFDKDLVGLLESLCIDVSYALDVLDEEHKRQQAESDLRRSEERYRTLFSSLTEGFALNEIICDEAGRLVDYRLLDINPAFEQLTGLKRENVIGKTHTEVLPDDDPSWIKVYEPVALRGEPVHFENYSLALKQHYEVFAYRIAPNQFAVLFLNITHRKEMEEALRKSESLYRAIGETIDYGVWVCDAQGRNTYASDSFLKMVGITQEQCSEFGWGDTLHPDDAERTIAAWKECVRTIGNWDIEHRFRGVDGKWHNVLARGVPIRDEQGQVTCWAGINLDVTELTAAQSELRRARDDLEQRVQERTLELAKTSDALKIAGANNRSLLEASLDPLVTITPEGKIGDVNAATELITGYSRDELIGTDFHSYFTDPARAQAGYQQVLEKGSVQHYLLEIRHRDGHITTVLYNASVYRDESGEVRGVFAAARDITELVRSEWEIRRLNSELEQRVIERTAQLEEANRMLANAKNEADKANNAKSEFLSRVSHELRTPLNSILGFAQLMEIYSQKAQPGVDINPSLQAKQDESLTHIVKAGSHLLDLINEVLEITRIETGRIPISPEPIRIDEIVNESVDLIRPLAAHKKLHIELKIEDICGLYVMADRQRLKEVLLNLLSNAVKYNLVEGSISFVCQQVEGERLRFSVTDTGYGIAAEMLPRIFTPFERLGVERDGIEGTGLGLALSKGLVTSMGGTIGVESTLGVGSTFWVELPLTEGPLERIKRENGSRVLAEKAGSTKKSTILYVEDNLSNLNLIEHILEFRPETRLITAMRGGTGLELAREHQPDLILLDLNMPDIPGSDVLQRLKADPLTRNIPVVVISADAMPSQITRLRQSGAKDYLTKPLDVKRFIELLDTVLGK